MRCKIVFRWDPEEAVWIATSNDVPGLVLESGSFDALVERVKQAVPELVKLNSSTQDLIEKEAIAFYKPFPLTQMSVRDLVRFLLRQVSPADILLLLLSMAFVTGIGMLLPWINRMLFTDVLSSGSGRALFGAAAFMICVTVSGLLFTSVRGLLTARIGMKLDLQAEASTMMRILSLPADFFKKYSAGELSSRAANITGLCSRIAEMAFSTGITALLSLLYIIQIYFFTPSLTAPALLVALLTLLSIGIQIAMRVKINRRRLEAASKESGMSFQLISGVQKIRLSGAERRAFAKWGVIYAKEAKLEYDPPLFLKIGKAIPLAISLAGTIMIYSSAVRSGVSTAEYYAFSAAYGMVAAALTAFADMAENIALFGPMLEMARPILEAVPEIAEDKPMVTRLSGGIELNNVTFRYTEDMPPVLDDISLTRKVRCIMTGAT